MEKIVDCVGLSKLGLRKIMKKEIVVICIVVVMVLISSCATNLHIRSSTIKSKVLLGKDHFVSKNYTIDKRSIAYVGQPVIKVQDYWVHRYKTPGNSRSMRASHNFVVTGGLVKKITGQADLDYFIAGETTVDGQTYTVLEMPNIAFVLLIKTDGSVHDEVFFRTQPNIAIPVMGSFTATPSDLNFIRLEEKEIKEIVEFNGPLNYELLYGGTDGKLLNISYREFTSDNLARSSFYQNLIYDSKQKTIRFRNTVITIHSATNEKIDYTVISDDLEK